MARTKTCVDCGEEFEPLSVSSSTYIPQKRCKDCDGDFWANEADMANEDRIKEGN